MSSASRSGKGPSAAAWRARFRAAHVDPGGGEVERQLVHALPGAKVSQGQASRVQWGAGYPLQPGGGDLPPDPVVEPEARRAAGAMGQDLLAHVGGEVGQLQQQVQIGAHLTAGGEAGGGVLGLGVPRRCRARVDITGQLREGGHPPLGAHRTAETARSQGLADGGRLQGLGVGVLGQRGDPNLCIREVSQIRFQAGQVGEGVRTLVGELGDRLMGVQQPAQGSLAGMTGLGAGPTPDQIEGGPSPGQGDIDEAHVLGQALLLRQAQVGLDLIRAGIEQGLAASVEADQALGIADLAAPEIGDEDHRVFEPLGTMDGDDLHQLGVALQAQFGGLAAAPIRRQAQLDPVPTHQGIHAGLGLGRLLQQLAQVQQVGQAPLGVRVPGQGLADPQALEHGLKHGHEAAPLPGLLEEQQVVLPGGPGVLALDDGLDLGVALAHQG